MEIVWLSGDPESRTPSVAPKPGFNDDESGAQFRLRHCKAGSSSEYSMEDFEHKDSVRLYKTSSNSTVERIMFPKI